MAKLRKISMAVGTFSVAFGIGFIMQNGNVLASRFGADSSPDQPAPFTQTVGEAAMVENQMLLGNSVLADNDVMPIPVTQGDVVFASFPEIMEPATAVSAVVILPEIAKVPVEK